MIKKILQKEDGMALPIVVAIIAIITLLGLTAVFLVSSQTAMGNRYEKSETALSIAEAGIYEYLWHLNKDSNFYRTPQSEDFVNEMHDFQSGGYKLDINHPTTEDPTIKIKSTGWLNSDENNKYALEVEVRKREFVQHIFMSDDEKGMNGQDVWWTSDDEVKGPFHTNGTLYIEGRPQFFDRVTYSKSIELYDRYSEPDCRKGPPEKVEPLVFPVTNQQLKTQAQYNGYYFEGRTCILLDGNVIKIRDKDNKVHRITDLKNGVIYVDGEVSDSKSKWNKKLGNIFISGKLNGRLTVAASNNIYITGYDPTEFDWWDARYTGGITYYDTIFDMQGNVVNDGDDMLGLIAGEYIRILHYGWFDDWSWIMVAPKDITIHAALFALHKSFEFEDYDEGSRLGKITLVGSICQYRRGAVGTFGSSWGWNDTGYESKDYTHDRRMAYDTPPHFLEPVNAGWEIVSWKRVTPSE